MAARTVPLRSSVTVEGVTYTLDATLTVEEVAPPPPPPPPPEPEPPPPADRKVFAFGPPGMPVTVGDLAVSEATAYTAARGHGWSAGQVQSRTRAGGDWAQRSFCFSRDMTFRVDLPAGNYNVAVLCGDADAPHDQMGVFVQGEQSGVLSAGAGEWAAGHYPAVVPAGAALLVTLRDLGGADPYAVLNRLQVTPGPEPADFPPAGSGPAPTPEPQPPPGPTPGPGPGHEDEERIRALVPEPTVSSARAGAWSSPLTWSPQRVPGAGDHVSVTHGVVYDVASDAALGSVALRPGGHLARSTSTNTRLVCPLLFGLGGDYVCGLETSPLREGAKAEHVFPDSPLDPAADPWQYGNGILWLEGAFVAHGAEKTPWVKLSAEAPAGTRELRLASPVSGWRPGDRVALADTRQDRAGLPSESETARVASVSADGLTVALESPLQHGHLGARDSGGNLLRLPDVANLTRNVVFRSADSAGTRGHAMFLGRSAVDVRHSQWGGMGRSTNAPFSDSNRKGRYAIHLHHMQGPAGGLPGGGQFRLEGNAVTCLMEPQPYRWGVALHDSHFGLVRGNVLYNWAGAGLVAEDGSETGNVIEGNWCAKVSDLLGGGLRADGREAQGEWGFEGTAFHFRGPSNLVRGNVAADCAGQGFSVIAKYLSEQLVPLAPGADPSEYTRRHMNYEPLAEFADNEAYACHSGVTLWWVGAWGNTPTGERDSVLSGFTAWNTRHSGVYLYENGRVVIEGLLALGDPAAWALNTQASWGVLSGDYAALGFLMRGCRVENYEEGLSPTTVAGGRPVRVEDCLFRCRTGLYAGTLWTSQGSADWIPPRSIGLDRVRFEAPAPGAGAWVMIKRTLAGDGSRNLIQSDGLTVRNHQGVEGDDFRVYLPEQRADFVVPQTQRHPNGMQWLVGCPEAGLTNAESLARHGVCICGEIAPASAVPRAGIIGLVTPVPG